MGVTAKFRSLLKNVYNSFNKDERIDQVFQITYSGVTAKYTIEDEFLRFQTSDPALDDLYIDLTLHTLQTLIDLIDANPRYSIITIPDFSGFAELSATSLIERENHDLSNDQQKRFFIFTNLLWVIFKAIAKEIQGAGDNFDSALRQMNILTAEDIFLDHWARDYYNEKRLEGESDYNYSRRTITTIIRPKINDIALELILIEILQFTTGDVRVITDPLIYNSNYTPGRGMIDTPVSENQINGRDFDNIVYRMIGGEGLEDPYSLRPGCFTVWIITNGECPAVDPTKVEDTLDRFKASGTCYTLRYLNITTGLVYAGATLDQQSGNVDDLGIYWSYSWIIRGDFSRVRGDFVLARKINFHASLISLTPATC